MQRPWENDNCENIRSYYTVYPVPVAAALWCNIPPKDVDQHLRMAEPKSQNTALGRAILCHPFIPCLEPRCRAIHEAIDSGALPVSREDGRIAADHVTPIRRHVSRQHLKEWIAREFPADKPAFLFDEVERATHTAINAESYRVLKAAHDAKERQLAEANERARTAEGCKSAMELERDALRAIIDKGIPASVRSEGTYLNIIGGLLGLMLGRSPSGKAQSVFESQAMIISALLAHHDGKPGISSRTLEEKFAEAKRSLNGS